MISLKDNKLVQKMLDRLFGALVNGPSLNARPHSSRQRIDLTQIGRLGDKSPESVLRELLGAQRESKVVAKIPPPKKKVADADDAAESGSEAATAAPTEGPAPADMGKRTEASPGNNSPGNKQKPALTLEEKAAAEAWSQQASVITKLRSIAEDARVYENDTGVHVLQIGYPLLSLPPGSFGAKGATKRVLAPICFISLTLAARSGPTAAVQMHCHNEGADLVQPNIALLAWLEQQVGKTIGELESDEAGAKPWDEIAEVVRRAAQLLELPAEGFASGEQLEKELTLKPCPRANDEDNKAEIVSSAIIGLFPLANQGLIRDTQAMLAGEEVDGPIESFTSVDVSLTAVAPSVVTAETNQTTESGAKPQAAEQAPAAVVKQVRNFSQERLIAPADPCQTRAVKEARTARGLVIHGPPGTGKSQTISNIIGDHLARGERVLFVCDKRTALDVVMDRLNAAGLGNLCAVVHDPQRDQRELYRSIREQLDQLTELRTNPGAEKDVARMDKELQALHAELTDYHAALMRPPAGEDVSFHEMMGQWLKLPGSDAKFDEALMAGVSPGQLDEQTRLLHEVFERGMTCGYPRNPWVAAAGVPLAKFLATPMDRYRRAMAACGEQAATLDATASEKIPPFGKDEDVIAAGAARAKLADGLPKVMGQFDAATFQKWAAAGEKTWREEAARLQSLAPQLALIQKGPLDMELAAAMPGTAPASGPAVASLNQPIAALEAYIPTTASMFGFFAFGKKKDAGAALGKFGLALNRENAVRARDFLNAVKARVLVGQAIAQLKGETSPPQRTDDELLSSAASYGELFPLLISIDADPHLKSIATIILKALASTETARPLIEGLTASPARAKQIIASEQQLRAAELFDEQWQAQMRATVRQGGMTGELIAGLSATLVTVEDVLRIRETMATFPPAIQKGAGQLLPQGIGAEEALAVLQKASLARAIGDRLGSDPRLQAADSQKLRSAFAKYSSLDAQRKTATRSAVLHHWGSRQKERLLALTGSRLNGAGADLRRRFTLRGERAMRLRQVIAVGHDTEGGDPLFDLRPVWMASPETVAQIFPRKPLFDAVIFDEASQCRLEEALPVLLRSKRVVIAGDPKQLPPSRFFESAISTSDDDEEIETDQQLFEVQQGEIEDLLAAALNVEIEECYLDVHYRSRNSDLIEFSNRNFYNSRLQAIPGHPSNRERYAPLTMYHVGGVYKERQNEAEATKISEIVRDLLKRALPPTIGIACFNISQRDMILDKLDELAESDPAFGRSLGEAKTRRVGGSFQGLFVKNLENVQGDERDHIIISTTYGPDEKGRFYKRFGPLGRAGGGRRLNVLVTRARDEVHIVTSIPPGEYRNLPPIPAGQNPGGPWLLFSYLAEAERLGELYEQNYRILSQAQEQNKPVLEVNLTKYPSLFSEDLGRDLVEDHATGATVHWGNDGFCIDVALHHPRHMEDVTIGVLCDVNRFEQAADPVEWEVFRTMILESQNWKLHRLWTPQYFRDPSGSTVAILESAKAFVASEAAKDAIPVTPTTPEEDEQHLQ